MIPATAAVSGDVYKAGVLAGHLWRVDAKVVFAYSASYTGPPVAFTLPLGQQAVHDRFHLPPFFAGLLPEGETRRGSLARALHIAEDDEAGLLIQIGVDTIGDVQVVPTGTDLPSDDVGSPRDLTTLSFSELWTLPKRLGDRSSVPGVQPKVSAHSRSLIGGRAGRVILKFSPDPAWRGLLDNEAHFMQLARMAGLSAPAVALVTDREGVRALAVARFDRSAVGDRLIRHAQEDAGQVLGLRPAQKYDPDARTIIAALADVCAAPPVAIRDLVHQLLYSYAIGNNDVHAKNLSVRQDPRTGLWGVTPVYDVLHTWPYEGDHRFHPAVTDRASDTVTRRHWVALADDLGLSRRLLEKLIDRVVSAVTESMSLLDAVGGTIGWDQALDIPPSWSRDVRRRIRRRVRDLQIDVW